MPEGPEIRRVADRLGKVLVDAPLRQVWFAYPALEAYAKTLSESRVIAVDSWGKALLITFDCGRVLYSHNQLYGVWRIHRAGQSPRTRRVLRAQLETSTHVASLYSASDISLWRRETLPQQPFLARLGPDLLTHDVTVTQIVERLDTSTFRRRGLGGLLLDQHFYAGIGNYLRSEILFYAGVAPRKRASDLSQVQRWRLAEEILDITHQAYREAGVTNRPVWREVLQRAGAPRARWRHAVFNRAGLACHACGSVIIKETIASRRLYRCPRCQPD
ncbi:endonuclease VIII [Salinicola aestuarinus]|uniref:endonuclease VIII n=1 Tax=Salinicola aestuarinus TaxID=1949082 RepID=UPI000DA10EC2|nr:endonuclease VIII [Salinicola aestuarinus]